MTLRETLDEFILSRRLLGLAEKSVMDYREFCGRFINFVGRTMEYQDLKQDNINDYILHLMKKPITKSTISTYLRHTKVYLKWCTQEYKETLFDYRKVKVPKMPKKNVLLYGDEEIRSMFKAVEADADWIIARNCAILALMLDSGLRQAELTRIKCKDMDIKRRSLNVHGKGNKDRMVPLGMISSRYIKEYLSLCPQNPRLEDYLFITRNYFPISTNAVKLMVTKLSNRLPFDISSHKLRHNFATNYCLNQYRERGQIDIYQLMYLLGHEDVKTTSRYLHFAYEIIATENSISHVDRIFEYEKMSLAEN